MQNLADDVVNAAHWTSLHQSMPCRSVHSLPICLPVCALAEGLTAQLQESPVQELLSDAQREVVADVVNAALLASASGKPRWEIKPQV